MLTFLDLTNIEEIHINLPQKYRNKENYKTQDIEYIKSLDSRIKIYRPKI